MAEEVKPKISGEYKAIDADYRRKVALVNARPKIETASLVLWAGFDIGLILAFVFGILFYVVSGSFTELRTSASIFANVPTTHTDVMRRAPAPLLLEDAKSASVVSGKYDLFASAENPNAEWYATFDYSFVYDGGETELMSGFMNPGDRRLLAAINLPLERRPASLRLVVQNQVWHRVDRHAIASTANFLAERSNITVEKATYTKDVTVGTEQIAQSAITLTNRTAYAYWSPEFLVKLMRGSTVVSLTKITIPEFQSGETRTAEVRWFGEVPPSGTIVLEPLLFYFDRSVYMNPDDETGLDVRR